MTQPAQARPPVLIVLPVHNRRATTSLFMRCLLAQTYTNWHLLLIDDGSTDGTADMVRSEISNLTVLRGTGDWWWAGALHQGYRWLRAQPSHLDDLVLIINDDTEFGPDFLENAVGVMRPRSLLLAQLYNQAGEFLETGVRCNWRRFDWQSVKETEGLNCFSTRGLFLWAQDFVEIGGFHPILLPHYLSDYEFTMRAHRKGFALVSSPQVSLRYNEHLTGIRNQEGLSAVQYLKTSLSVKCTGNPVYWSSFVMLASPLRYMPANLATVWWRFFEPLVRRLWLYRITYRIARRVYRATRQALHS